MYAKWKTLWICINSQEVGLEAATLYRKRNSSLVESACAEDSTGLKLSTEATDERIYAYVVEERSVS